MNKVGFMKHPVILSWSGGKDCLMALDVLQRGDTHRVVALITSVARFNDAQAAHVPQHDTSAPLMTRQAAALGLPLRFVEIPVSASNVVYEAAWLAALRDLRKDLFHDESPPPTIAFGDLFLADVRAYREALLARAGWQGMFPLWGRDTRELARRFIADNFKAVVTSVDREKLDASFVGKMFDAEFIADLPEGVDPCGERGEFHTFAFDGKLFRQPVRFTLGAVRSTATHHASEAT
jgi:uncharacterized protein (TIGR00290 family)